MKLSPKSYVGEFCAVNSVYCCIVKREREHANVLEARVGSVKEFSIFLTSAAFFPYLLSVLSFYINFCDFFSIKILFSKYVNCIKGKILFFYVTDITQCIQAKGTSNLDLFLNV